MQHKQLIGIGLIWLFHLSGIVGMALGYEEWFLSKTPLNLLACFIILLIIGPIKTVKQGLIIYSFFMAGIFVEWVGVTTGFPFGSYYYGENLGAKMAGVPYMIGINWAMLVLITGTMATRLSNNILLRIMIGAALMVFLDLFIEPTAPVFDFWYWEADHIPLSNYVAWFVIAALLHWIFQKQITTLDFKLSLNLYLAQMTFFISFYGYTQL
jgi:putative membrane protein